MSFTTAAKWNTADKGTDFRTRKKELQNIVMWTCNYDNDFRVYDVLNFGSTKNEKKNNKKHNDRIRKP